MVSAPSEADDVEALVFNHFERYFAIKDPLMFRIEIYHGPEIKRVWRILRPNESIVINMSDYFPKWVASEWLARFQLLSKPQGKLALHK